MQTCRLMKFVDFNRCRNNFSEGDADVEEEKVESAFAFSFF
jgi:hypothetical protein